MGGKGNGDLGTLSGKAVTDGHVFSGGRGDIFPDRVETKGVCQSQSQPGCDRSRCRSEVYSPNEGVGSGFLFG